MSGNIFLAVVSRGKNTTLMVNRQMWMKSSIRYTGIGNEAGSVSCKILVRRQWYLISHRRCRSQVSTMKSRPYPLNVLLYLLLLYLRTYYTYWWTYWCMYVPTVPTTVPTVRARTITNCCPVRTTYWHTYELHWNTYVYILKKKGHFAE